MERLFANDCARRFKTHAQGEQGRGRTLTHLW
jgi:hypothetical protein